MQIGEEKCVGVLVVAPVGRLDSTTSSKLEQVLRNRARVMLKLLIGPPPSLHATLMQREMCDPSGPIEKGTTYKVRPRMQPANRRCIVARISFGATQFLVGPASSSRSLQMNVRSSTRATSDGSERAR